MNEIQTINKRDFNVYKLNSKYITYGSKKQSNILQVFILFILFFPYVRKKAVRK